MLPRAPLPPAPGVGFKAQHFADLMADPGPVAWIEVHAENYMGGGRPMAQLRHLAERFPVSVHGVGLSIGGEGALNADHLARLKTLCDWLQPASFSEHLAWSSHGGAYLNSLLPLPYTQETLTRICAHITQVQEALSGPMLLENPSSYFAFPTSTWSEADFLTEITARTGCGLLLDVNNVFISAHNLGFEPMDFIRTLPLAKVGEVHLGGHDLEIDAQGAPVLIDSHGAPVAADVWAFYAATIALTGPKPSLIEWDNDVPDWATLAAEAARAAKVLSP
jgi:uncharacterized protein (UPF0276 family)